VDSVAEGELAGIGSGEVELVRVGEPGRVAVGVLATDQHRSSRTHTTTEKRAMEIRDCVDDPRADMLWMPPNMMPIGEGAVAMEERLGRLQAAKAAGERR